MVAKFALHDDIFHRRGRLHSPVPRLGEKDQTNTDRGFRMAVMHVRYMPNVLTFACSARALAAERWVHLRLCSRRRLSITTACAAAGCGRLGIHGARRWGRRFV